jgi:prolyl-tRNA editing enzyme YbaK/EbsC (Cys-tRNA(Pro) deacylase)
MPIIKKLEKFLKDNKIQYQGTNHRTVFTAHDKAATLRIPEKTIGKTLVIKTDRDLVLVLISGNKNFDKGKFKKTLNDWRKKTKQKPVKDIDFASEVLMKNRIKGVKVGAVPPFGKLWKFPAFIDKALGKEKEVILNSGNYNSSIKIKQKEFKKLEFIQGNFSKSKK